MPERAKKTAVKDLLQAAFPNREIDLDYDVGRLTFVFRIRKFAEVRILEISDEWWDDHHPAQIAARVEEVLDELRDSEEPVRID